MPNGRLRGLPRQTRLTGTVIATAISQMVRSESIYTLKLKRGGIDFTTLDEARLMDAILVDESKTKDFVAVSRRLPLAELMDKMGRNKEKSFYTVDDDGYLFGQVNLTDIEEALFERESHLILADDISTPPATCFPNENLNDALRTMRSRHVTHLAVVDPTDPRRIVGALRREDILRSYTKIASHRADQLSKMDQARDGLGLGTIEVRFRVSRRSRLIGKAIKDLSLPEGAVFTSVRRGRDTIIPRGQTVLKGGDLITALVSPKVESQFGGWRTENKV